MFDFSDKCIISRQLHYTTSQAYHIGVCYVEAIAQSTSFADFGECATSIELRRWDLAPVPVSISTPSTRCLGKPLQARFPACDTMEKGVEGL
ncbi:uncharacterized protein MYCFIDRAFT_204889 [Pseudocercospora fijiensis CIRAD86]|uniref:Uncharacterized protein n=1 Tax=Pseudocercospora fijiensis (strain CIRAD86) TaxID=383855 RepID=M3ARA7_PSEFD|nr:uncharacterized protein MYCFIDRAFT_204889 [Pseudocercospora fijiensis CIRAD86]EME79623.1 hypothetical protein MYCFIDRAFT_204889 [Pseudocercospora fijiensis CIRAD86]